MGNGSSGAWLTLETERTAATAELSPSGGERGTPIPQCCGFLPGVLLILYPHANSPWNSPRTVILKVHSSTHRFFISLCMNHGEVPNFWNHVHFVEL
jgi:hypothetical protein